MVSQIEMIEMVGVGWISLENKKAAKGKLVFGRHWNDKFS